MSLVAALTPTSCAGAKRSHKNSQATIAVTMGYVALIKATLVAVVYCSAHTRIVLAPAMNRPSRAKWRK